MQREKTLRRTPKPKRLPPQKMVKSLQANRKSNARRSESSQGRGKIVPTTTTTATTTTATTGAGVALATTTKIEIATTTTAIATTIITTVAGGTAIVPAPFSRNGVYHGEDPTLPTHRVPATRGTKPLGGIVAQPTIRATAIQIRQQAGAIAKAEEEEEVEEDPTKEGEAEVEERVRI